MYSLCDKCKHLQEYHTRFMPTYLPRSISKARFDKFVIFFVGECSQTGHTLGEDKCKYFQERKSKKSV